MTRKQYHKIMFLQNALEQGWKIKKRNGTYIFSKNHENNIECFSDDYLEQFISSNIANSMDSILVPS